MSFHVTLDWYCKRTRRTMWKYNCLVDMPREWRNKSTNNYCWKECNRVTRMKSVLGDHDLSSETSLPPNLVTLLHPPSPPSRVDCQCGWWWRWPEEGRHTVFNPRSDHLHLPVLFILFYFTVSPFKMSESESWSAAQFGISAIFLNWALDVSIKSAFRPLQVDLYTKLFKVVHRDRVIKNRKIT